VQEAARRDMKVVLYDEGMYPSGSASGQVVEENSAYACRGLACVELEAGAQYSALPDEQLLGHFSRGGKNIAIINRPVDAVIRGLHYIDENEDGSFAGEAMPPAADILNPGSVACFIRLVYDRFHRELGEYFGTTIIGIFTDEPGLLGRLREKTLLWPGTRNILDHVNRTLGYDFTPRLPALFFDDEPDAAYYRQEYSRAVNLRLEETYYQPLSAWCEKHGVALMGHPAQPDDIGLEKYFHIPGQDIVWRYIEPDKPSALEGPQSTQAKCTSSAMLHQGRRRNSNECYGAYGHELTFEEMKWLADWLFARGVNMLLPHAFYYSMRGPRRDERPPDVGPNSAWWGEYSVFADYCRRLSWLNTDCRHICSIAILGAADFLPWRAAKVCFQHQRDFNYLELRDLYGKATVDESGIHIGNMNYQALIVDDLHVFPNEARAALQVLGSAGRVVQWQTEKAVLSGAAQASTPQELVEMLDRLATPDFAVSPHQPDLRVRCAEKHDTRFYLLFNEGASTLEFTFEPSNGNQKLYSLNAWTGKTQEQTTRQFSLASRQTIIVYHDQVF
jgi:hypothetical protein